VDIVDDRTLFFDCLTQRLFVGACSLQLIAKIFVGFLEALAMTGAVAQGVADHEAEGGGQDHPYRYEVRGVFGHATFSCEGCS
jgi:hypothetical protein